MYQIVRPHLAGAKRGLLVFDQQVPVGEGEMGPTRPYVLLLALILPALAFVPGATAEDPTTCDGVLPPGTYDNVIVPSGHACEMEDVTIMGSVTLEAGHPSPGPTTELIGNRITVHGTIFANRFSDLLLVHSTLHGSVGVLADEDSGVRLTGSQIRGNVEAKNPRFISLSGPASRGSVGGNIQILGGGSVRITDYNVGGSVQIGGIVGTSIVFAGSVVGGDVQLRDSEFEDAIIAFNGFGGNVQVADNSGIVNIDGNTIGGNLQCTGNDPPPLAAGNLVAGNKEGQCSGP